MMMDTPHLRWFKKAVSALERWTRPHPGEATDALRYWQERVLRSVGLAASVLGLFVYVVSVWLSLKERLWLIALVDTLMYAWMILIVVRTSLSYRFRSGSLVMISYLLGVVLLGVLGPFGAGPVWLFVFPILTGTLMGQRASLAALGLNALTLAATGAAIWSGVMQWPIPDANPMAKWLVTSVNFILLDAMATITITVLLHGLRSALEQEKVLRWGVEESEARLKTIFETVHAGILIIDADTLHIADANPAAADMVGQPRNVIVGHWCREHLAASILDVSSRPDEPVMSVDSELLTAGGGRRPVLLSVVPVTLNRRAHLLASFLDISDLRRAENDRVHLESELAQARKMEALGTLAGGIAHDFNNILMALIGFTELAMVKADAGSEIGKDLESVFKAAQRARELVHQILSFSRRDERQNKPVRIKPLVIETLDLFRATLPGGIGIKTVFTGDPVAMIDATQFHQVLMNLYTNARHAMKENGGTIEVGIAEQVAVPIPRRLQVVQDSRSWLHIWIRDEGCGIPPQIAERIFEPFFTTRQAGEGTGMGLSVVHGIIKSHGGEIAVESAPGAGTRVSVYLPMVAARAEGPPDKPTTLPRGAERIMVVDDDETVLAATEGILESLGYQVVSENSGATALERLKKQPDAVDLVLTDITMPEMLGTQLLTALVAVRSDLPVILITGDAGLITPEKAIRLGAAGIAAKPLIRSELARLVREALDARMRAATKNAAIGRP